MKIIILSTFSIIQLIVQLLSRKGLLTYLFTYLHTYIHTFLMQCQNSQKAIICLSAIGILFTL